MSLLTSRLWCVGGQIATCDRKVQYSKMSAALLAAHRFDKPLRPYRCPVCNEWHLTKGIIK